MLAEFRVGPNTSSDGTVNPGRVDRTGATIISDGHGRFTEGTLRQGLYSGGMTITSISNATFTTATLGATATPIIGLWNPLTNTRYLYVLQAKLQLITTTLTTPTGPGALMWCTAVGQSAISTGIAPLNRYTLANAGSVAKVFAGTALTGLSGNLTVQEASGLTTYPINTTAAETAAGFMPAAPGGVENIDGSFAIPPGGVLALLCTTTPVAISGASAILWEEV